MYILQKENVERRTDSEERKEALLRQGFLRYEPPAAESPKEPPVDPPKEDEPPKEPAKPKK